MAAPKDSEHSDARNERWHILKSSQESFDIVRDLLRNDYQRRDCKSKRSADKSFQPRHLDSAQTKSAKPRQRIQVWRQTGGDFLCALVHPIGDTTAMGTESVE
jgi:hypothetical protein